MGAEAVLVAEASGGEFVATATIVTVDQSHHLCRTIPVIVLRDWPLAFRERKSDQFSRTGGRNVPVATSQRPLKIRKSARGTPGVFDLAVSTQKMEGSM